MVYKRSRLICFAFFLFSFKTFSEVSINPASGILNFSILISSICQYPILCSYNPQVTKSAVGEGWQCSLDTELQISKEIEFYTVNAYCSKFVFNRDADGTFSSGSDRATLIFSNNNYILTSHEGEKLTFDPEGILKSIQDVSGKTAELTRDSKNRIASWNIKSDEIESFSADDMLSGNSNEKSPSGSGGSISWNDNGTIAKLSSTNEGFNFIYGNDGRIAKIISDSKEILASFEYDSVGQLISIVDPNHEYSFTYYEDGRVKTIEDQKGDDIYVEYEVVDGLNNCTVWNLTKFTETIYIFSKEKIVVTQSPIDSEVQYSAEINIKTGERKITNHSNSSTYIIKGDAKGNIHIDSNLLGFTPLVSESDFLNSVTKNINNVEYFRESTVPSDFELTEVRSKIKNDGIIKDYLGNLMQIVNKNFNIANFSYDKSNRVNKMKTPSGGEYLYEYTTDGKIKKTTDPFGYVQEYTYLPDNKIDISLPSREIVSITYDEWGFPISIKEPQDRETVITYYNRGEIESVNLKDFDNQFFLPSLEDGMISLQSNLYGSWLFRDSFDGRLTRIGPDGNIIFFDLLQKRLISVLDSEEKALETYLYNEKGQLIECSTPQTSVSYKYDGRGRLVEKKYNKLNFAINFAYNKQDFVNIISDTRDFKTEYTTDTTGKLIEIKNNKTGSFRIEYANNGQINSIFYPNGITIKKSYDKAERLAEYDCVRKDEVLEKVNFEYDQLGNVIVVNNNGEKKKYSYDSLCHITQVEDQDGKKDLFSFDKWGNFYSKEIALTIDDQSRVLTAEFPSTNLKFNYGYNNLLSRVEDREKNLEIYYNPVDNLPAKVINADGNATNYIFIDTNLYAVTTQKKSEVTRYIYIFGTNICLAIVRADGSVVYPVTDPSGTITSLYDVNGDLISERKFDILGRLEGADNLNIATGFQGAVSLLDQRIVVNEGGQYLVHAQRLLSKIAPVPGKYALDFNNKLSYLDGNPAKNINSQRDQSNNLALLDE